MRDVKDAAGGANGGVAGVRVSVLPAFSFGSTNTVAGPPVGGWRSDGWTGWVTIMDPLGSFR